MAGRFIEVVGARQNNLKNVSVRIPIGAVTAVTGVAGAGKSSLALDVLYAEGHRRYAETFSPYARQFLERLDRPRAERIDDVLPAIAVDRTAPVRTSRSTVATLTSVADYLRALCARAGLDAAHRTHDDVLGALWRCRAYPSGRVWFRTTAGSKADVEDTDGPRKRPRLPPARPTVSRST